MVFVCMFISLSNEMFEISKYKRLYLFQFKIRIRTTWFNFLVFDIEFAFASIVVFDVAVTKTVSFDQLLVRRSRRRRFGCVIFVGGEGPGRAGDRAMARGARRALAGVALLCAAGNK